MLKRITKKWLVRISILAIIVAGIFAFTRASISLKQVPTRSVRWGITFSTVYASYLGLDVMKTYQDLVENLGVRVVRFPVYWPDIEPQDDAYTWDQLDAFIKYSEDHDVKLTLVLGRKVPRWPECFIPNWAQNLSQDDRQKAVLDMMRQVVVRYRTSKAIERWQLENEPFLPFGVCQQIRDKDLREEIAYVRSLDSRPIQMTASGEMEPWKATGEMSDIFGISVYRTTWNTVFGYFTYPLSPLFYRLKSLPVVFMEKKMIVSELQAEPWFSEDMKNQSAAYWYNAFNAHDFEENARFVKEMHVSEAYLWGAEWWAYLKQNGEDRLWNAAKDLFSK